MSDVATADEPREKLDEDIEEKPEERDEAALDEEEPVEEIDLDIGDPKPVMVGGETYGLLTIDHLSPEKEDAVTATFARFQRVFERMSVAKSDAAAVKEAAKLRRYREQLIALMTTVPKPVIRRLTAGKQGRLMELVRIEITSADEEDEDDGAEVDEG